MEVLLEEDYLVRRLGLCLAEVCSEFEDLVADAIESVLLFLYHLGDSLDFDLLVDVHKDLAVLEILAFLVVRAFQFFEFDLYLLVKARVLCISLEFRVIIFAQHRPREGGGCMEKNEVIVGFLVILLGG